MTQEAMSNTTPDQELAEKLASERILEALAKVQRAQNLLSDAAAALSPIMGMRAKWDQVCKLSDKCKDYWFALDRMRHEKVFRIDDLVLDLYKTREHSATTP